jgi:tetratricopeptide (TPR) repeat protein
VTTIETVFAEALTLDPEARAHYLAARCDGRPLLRQEVESLLAAHARRGPLDLIPTTDPPADPADSATNGAGGATDAAADAAPPNAHAGLIVGQFRLLDEIGRGGMGTVYRAERRDGQFTQHVAVKLIDAGPPSPRAHVSWPADAAVLRRYRAERQILASLQHPHIVTLIDAGLTEDGRAYLAMEVVDGVPITRDCERRPLADRLRLFRDVCAAVHYAHQHAVVHRDLKPANILVTQDGVVKVLDFGVAKLLDESTHEDDRTAVGAPRPLTPNYASPEQLRGLPVTTACDVYALGVLLYELVTGTRPYDTAGLTLERIAALVGEQEPPRPSTRVTAPAARRALAGDLDAIVSKAMRKEPAERYASAQALAEDLARHFAGQPIVAREPSFAYLAAKLARRHKGAVLSAAVAMVLLLVAFGVSLYQTRVAQAARARADARFADVRQLANSLIFKAQDDVQGLPGSTPVRKAIIAEALAYLERLSRDPAGDDGLRLDLASAYHRIGRVQGLPSSANLGDRDGARQSFKKAIDLLRPLAFGPKARHDAAVQLGRVDLDLATTARVSGMEAEAEAAMREAGEVADAWIARNPKDVEARRLRGSALFSQALGARENGLPLWQEAGDVFRSLLAEQPDSLDYMRNVALVEKYVGEQYGDRDDWTNAVSHYRQALQLDQQRLARLGANRTAQMDLAIDLSGLARAQWNTGQFDEAAAGYTRTLALRQQLADADPQDVLARSRVAFAHYMLGRVLLDQHRPSEALDHEVEAVRIQEQLAQTDPMHANELGRYLNQLGAAQQQSGPLHVACQTWRRAESVLTSLRLADGGGPPNAEQASPVRHELDAIHRRLSACEVKAAAARPAPPRS